MTRDVIETFSPNLILGISDDFACLRHRARAQGGRLEERE